MSGKALRTIGTVAAIATVGYFAAPALLGGGAAAGGSAAAAGSVGGISTTSLPGFGSVVSAAGSTSTGKGFFAGLSTFQKIGLVGQGLNAFGQFQAGQAADANATFNARLMELNAKQAEQNAKLARISAERDAERTRRDTLRRVGSIRSIQAKSGVVLSEGSPLLVQEEQRQEGAIEAGTQLFAGELEATGFQQRAASERLRAQATRSNRVGTFGNMASAGASLLTGSATLLS